MFSCEFCGKMLRSGIAAELMVLGRKEMHAFCDRECLIAWDSGLARRLIWPMPWVSA